MKGLLAIFLSTYMSVTWGAITPEIVKPVDFDKGKFVEKRLGEISFVHYTKQTYGCNDVIYKQYSPSSYKSNYKETDVPDKIPVDEWSCLYDIDVYGRGYSTVRLRDDIFLIKRVLMEGG